MKNLRSPYLYIVLIAMFLELGMQTLQKNAFGPFVSPVILLLSGLLVGGGGLAFFFGRSFDLPPYRAPQWWRSLLFFLLFLAGTLATGWFLRPEIQKHPITDYYNTLQSDVIPQIGILVDRFLNGEFPYRWINVDDWAFNHNLYPTYLPLQWMPFVIPELIGMDLRWFAFLMLISSFLIYARRVLRWEISLWKLGILILLPFVFLISYLYYDDEGMFRFSVETLITAYYLFLGLSLLTNSGWIMGIGLALCLFSRYSVVLWVPLFFLVLLLKGKRQQIWQAVAVIVITGLVVYFIPFFSKDPAIFINGYDYHSKGAIAAWRVMPWQAEGEPPFALYKGLGFGLFIYEFMEGSLEEKVKIYRLIHFVLSLLSVAGPALIFWRIRNKIDHKIFLLCSLKIYLVVFYNFIQIPFGYLYFVPTFLSIPIFAIMLGSVKVQPAPSRKLRE